MRSIPHIDMARWLGGDDHERRRLASEVDSNLQRLGFLVVTNHGIERTRIEHCRDRFREFFHLPISDKEPVRLDPVAYRGWVGPGLESNAATAGVETPPDAKETFGFGPVDVPDDSLPTMQWRWYGPNLWPERPADLREVAEWWWRSARELTDALARAVRDGPPPARRPPCVAEQGHHCPGCVPLVLAPIATRPHAG